MTVVNFALTFRLYQIDNCCSRGWITKTQLEDEALILLFFFSLRTRLGLHGGCMVMMMIVRGKGVTADFEGKTVLILFLCHLVLLLPAR